MIIIILQHVLSYVYKIPCSATPEYQALIKFLPQLMVAVEFDLISLSAQLLQRYLITVSQEREIRNQMSKTNRAANLLALVLNKVDLDSNNYHVFIEVLEEDEDIYKDILYRIKEEYYFLSGGEHVVIIFLRD